MEASATHEAAHSGHSPEVYVRIWGILLVLLVISIVGPMFGIRVVTIITAFGIAIVKAMLVASYFMHLNVERKMIWYLLVAMLLTMGLFFAGTSADVMTGGGLRWTNQSAQEHIQQHQGGEKKDAHH